MHGNMNRLPLAVLVFVLGGVGAGRAVDPVPPAEPNPAPTRWDSHQPIHPKGPGQIPARLDGLWKISVCASQYHAWIRFENQQTHEVHTLGRYDKNAGGKKDHATGEWIVPPVQVAGVMWDQDLRFEGEIREAGRYILLSVLVESPDLYLGLDNGVGYGSAANNCATFARDAWQHYSGERYRLSHIHLPSELAGAIWRRHPEVPLLLRLKLAPPG